MLFEPQPVHALALDRFQIENPDAQIVRSAVGGTSGSALFDAGDAFGGVLQDVRTADSIVVPVVTLDEALATAKSPLLVKLDTHGAEAAILAGAQVTLARSSAWIVETYNQQITPDCLLFWDLCSYMVTRGFLLIDLIDASSAV